MKTTQRTAFRLGASACLFVALCSGCEQTPTPTATPAPTPTPSNMAAAGEPALVPAGELNESDADLLQGFWEDGAVTVNISGNALFFYERADHWFQTEFTLPAGTDPKQLQATIIRDNSETDDNVGVVVIAIFKFEDGTLILAPIDSPPGSFNEEELSNGRYNLVRAQPRAGRTGPPAGG